MGLVPIMVHKIRWFTCKECSKDFSGRFTKARMFCSIQCRQKYRNSPERNPAKTKEAKKKISESRKGKPTTKGRILPRSQRDNISKALAGRKLTEEHKANISKGLIRGSVLPPKNEHLVGPNHWNWQGGKSSKRQKEYFSNPNYKSLIETVLKRDDWTCHNCGKRGGKLEVHHSIPFADNPDLAFDIDNCITLCRPCHLSEHRNKPRPG